MVHCDLKALKCRIHFKRSLFVDQVRKKQLKCVRKNEHLSLRFLRLWNCIALGLALSMFALFFIES